MGPEILGVTPGNHDRVIDSLHLQLVAIGVSLGGIDHLEIDEKRIVAAEQVGGLVVFIQPSDRDTDGAAYDLSVLLEKDEDIIPPGFGVNKPFHRDADPLSGQLIRRNRETLVNRLLGRQVGKEVSVILQEEHNDRRNDAECIRIIQDTDEDRPVKLAANQGAGDVNEIEDGNSRQQ